MSDKCPVCEGAGKIDAPFYTKRLCGDCDGTGIDVPDRPAPTPPAIGGDRAAEAIKSLQGWMDRTRNSRVYTQSSFLKDAKYFANYDAYPILAALARLKPAAAKPGITREAIGRKVAEATSIINSALSDAANLIGTQACFHDHRCQALQQVKLILSEFDAVLSLLPETTVVDGGEGKI